MEFVKTFGLNPVLLLAQIVNFLILLFLLNRFLYKPILSLLKEREERIKKGILDAQNAQKLLEDARTTEQKILKDASLQAQQIVQTAREDIERMKLEFEEKMRLEHEQMLKDVKQEIQEEKTLMEKGLMRKITLIAAEMLEKVLNISLGTDDRKKITNHTLKELEKHMVS